MKKIIILIIIVKAWSIFGLKAQGVGFNSISDRIINLGEVSSANENFNDYAGLKKMLIDVDIVMLGEQSHGEATTYETKIKLIKYLHKELGFNLLVFESGFYDCQKAWQLIEQGEDMRDAFGKSVFYLWSTTKELKPLVQYMESTRKSENSLRLMGFDSQFTGKLSENYFLSDLSMYLRNIDSSIMETDKWRHFVENISYTLKLEAKKLKKNNPKLDTVYINYLIQKLDKTPSDSLSIFWIQALKNCKVFLSDISLKTDKRDKQMAENLIWIKEKYPDSKIICWGATSHFLYNSTEVRMNNPIIQLLAGNYYKKHPMMGHYIKEKYDAKVFTIGFTAFQGNFGLFRLKKIKPAKKGTLEWLLNQSEYDNFLLPLVNLKLEEYQSRPLGNFYMRNDICRVMDAVVFNRNMSPPNLDRNFFLKIYPENKYIKPEIEN